MVVVVVLALVTIVTETIKAVLLIVAVVVPPQSYCSEERWQFGKSKILAVVALCSFLLLF